MAFIIFKQPHNGKRAVTIDRASALKLQKAMQAPHLIKNKQQREYVENIRQLSIPDHSKPTYVQGEFIPADNFTPSGKDLAAGRD